MKFVSSSALFVAVAAISSSVVPGRAKEFDNDATITKAIKPKRGGIVKTLNKNNNNNNEKNNENKNDKNQEGGKDRKLQFKPPIFSPNYGPQSFDEGSITSEYVPAAVSCIPAYVETKSYVNDSGMKVQLVAPRGTDEYVSIDNPDNEDIILQQNTFVAGGEMTYENSCVDAKKDCYFLIVRDIAEIGFENGYAEVYAGNQLVFQINKRDVFCGYGLICGDNSSFLSGEDEEAYFTFDTSYVYATIGSCEVTN